jgi:hypothetical protein
VSNAVDPVLSPTAPGPPGIASFAPDSHVVGGMNSANMLTLNGTGEANSTVNVYDGTTQIGTAAVGGNGGWSFATSALTGGGHSFTTTDTDSNGTSTASAALNVNVGAAALTVNFNSLVHNTNGTVTLGGTGEANSTVAIYDGLSPTPLGTATVGSNGTWSFTSATSLPNGVQNLTALATDAAGNTGASSGVAVLGTTGKDTLSGPSGNDVFTGNGQADTFQFAANFGHDIITDFQVKGGNHDVIQFSTSTFKDFNAVMAAAHQVGADTVITDANHDTLTLTNTKASSLQSADFHFA